MKTFFYLSALVLMLSCAIKSPLEKANIEQGAIYRITNPNLSTTLYVKFLPPTGGGDELLFKTVKNSEVVTSLEQGGHNVYHQKGYVVSERAKVSFRFFDEGLFEELLRSHQYASSGGQQDKTAMFRYRLDFRKAIKIE